MAKDNEAMTETFEKMRKARDHGITHTGPHCFYRVENAQVYACHKGLSSAPLWLRTDMTLNLLGKVATLVDYAPLERWEQRSTETGFVTQMMELMKHYPEYTTELARAQYDLGVRPPLMEGENQ